MGVFLTVRHVGDCFFSIYILTNPQKRGESFYGLQLPKMQNVRRRESFASRKLPSRATGQDCLGLYVASAPS
jgi:hypothetical protein